MKTALGYTFIITFFLSVSSCGDAAPITFLDYSNNLEKKIDTIEVTYIAWACACANWINTDYFEKNPNYANMDYSKECFFIEAKNRDNKLPEKYHINGSVVRLIGSFYKDKGISRDYMKPTSQKPDKSRVFRYAAYEVIGGE